MSANKDLEKLLSQIKKNYGDSSAYHLSDIPRYDIISTGSLSLDYALGIGGFPSNRVVEVAGKEGAGKTTLALHILNGLLHRYPDKGVAFIDMEHKLEADWVVNFVDDVDRLLVIKPGDAEEGINVYRDVVRSGLVSAVVWDSIGGSPTSNALKKDANTSVFAGNSGVITQFARYAATLSGKHNVLTIGINQTRQDMGGYNRLMVPGGNGWKHACSIRLEVKRGPKKDGEAFQVINGEEQMVGYLVNVKVIKSSVSPPGRVASYWFYNVENDLGFGIDKIEEVARLSTLTGVVERRGGWHYHKLIPSGKILGLPAFSKFLKDNPRVMQSLFDETMSRMQSGSVDMSDIVPMTADPEESMEEAPSLTTLAFGSSLSDAKMEGLKP